MQAVSTLVSFCLRQVTGVEPEELTRSLFNFFSDQSKVLPNALQVAHQRAWQAFELAIVGRSLHGPLKPYFTDAQIKAFSQQVEQILQTYQESFRRDCLREFQQLHKQGLLTTPLAHTDIAANCLGLERFMDQQCLIDAAWKTVAHSAQQLEQQGFQAIGALLQHPTREGPPLLVVAFGYFLRREVSHNPLLNDELHFDTFRRMEKQQKEGFQALETAMEQLGEGFQQALNQLGEQLSRVEATVTQTHQVVLNLDQALTEARGDIRQLLQEVQQLKQLSVTHSPTPAPACPALSKPVPVALPASRELVPECRPQPPSLPMAKPQLWTLTVRVDPADCGYVLGGNTYPADEMATLKAGSHSPQWRFSHWSGDVSGQKNPLTIKMTQHGVVTAHFQPAWVEVQLEVEVEPPGSGWVEGAGTYLVNQSVHLMAQPNPGWQFSHWSGDLSGSHPDTTLLLTQNKRLTAHFISQASQESASPLSPPVRGLGKAFQSETK